jgi:phenylalanyl-tRNA synthetase beta chain
MKFSLEWLGDFVDTGTAGGAEAVRALLEQAGFPLESIERAGEDVLLDVEITPNRPDAMSHRGLAREIAAMARLPLAESAREPEGAGRTEAPVPAGEADDFVSVSIEVPRLCHRFGARVVRGLGSSPAPERVRRRLAAIGGKSISAAVDGTNYVLWEIGQPLHAFDLDRLRGGRIVVRRARRGERLVLLDGVERALMPSDLVVADAERPVSLAGIMGGLETAVTAETRNVLLEAAWWDPASIRKTARRLSLHTDASHRFERGADPEAIPEALDRAAGLLAAAGGRTAEGWIDARGQAWKTRKLSLRLSRLHLLSGDDRLELDFAAESLLRLGFGVEVRGKRVSVKVPSWRPDVALEDDLVEEVLRVYGYHELPSRLPATRGGGGRLEPLRETEERLADVAAAAGLYETMSVPFVDRRQDEASFAGWLAATGSATEPLSLSNPLDETRKDLRATLLPGLLDAAARNLHRGEPTVGLFEVGRVFDRAGDPDDPPSFESRRFAFAIAGLWRSHWSEPPALRQADFFDARGLAEILLRPWLDPAELDWEPFDAAAFARGAAALIGIPGGEALGVVGLVSIPELAKRKLSEPVFAGEIRVEAISRPRDPVRFSPYSDLPPVEADLSFTLPVARSWREIEACVKSPRPENLESVRVVDRYEGPALGEGRIKTTIRLTFRSAERTLAQEEINREVAEIRERLRNRLGAVFD